MPEYEGTIIRPPSEADSLILQYTIGCSHNQCIFCPAYKQKQFRVRSLGEMERDLLECLPSFSDTRRIFLADGDALVAPTQDLHTLFKLLKSKFSKLTRIGMYANAKSILEKSGDELIGLREKGLGILYLGVESGDDELLAWMGKGVTAAQTVEAGRRVKEAGIKLSVTILLGIAGIGRSIEHARATGRIISEIGPDYVGALTTMIVPGTPLNALKQAGKFSLPSPFDILKELAEIIVNTEMRGLFFANHASNYLPLSIRMPGARDDAVRGIQKFIEAGNESLLRPDRTRRL